MQAPVQPNNAQPDNGARPFQARAYQLVAVETVLERVSAGRRRLLLHLPTGAGKTVIATLLLERLRRERPGLRVLFVAHRKEIVDQTARTLRRHIPGLDVQVEQGARRVEGTPEVVVASVQSLVGRKAGYDPAQFGLIICDECHRALAPSWTEVLQYFGAGLMANGVLLGLTATPRRTDGRSAQEVFDEVAYEITRAELQDLGYLSPMRYFSAQADLNLDRVKKKGGDFQVSSLSAVMNTPPIRHLTLEAWRERGMGRKTLAFCAGVDHAEAVAADFREHLGARCAVVSGRSRDRDEILAAFRDGELDVVANYGVLTEGYDEPSIECVLMARPTTSPLVYTQCLGRGLRPSEGKHFCTVIDIVDRSATPLQYGASHMAGLPKGWNSRGRDPFREQRAVRAISVTDPVAFMRIKQATSLEDIQSILMELPPEVVTAGLDGGPVPRYDAHDKPLQPRRALNAVKALLLQAGTSWKDVSFSDEQTVRIHMLDPGTDNDQFAYLQWHLERVSQARVEWVRPRQRRSNEPSPRALLLSMLRPGLTLKRLELETQSGIARAQVIGLRPGEGAWLKQQFAQETGIALDLGGQLAFPF